MVLIDKRILAGGIAMVAVGIVLTLYLNSATPLGESGMTEEEAAELRMQQRENQDLTTLSGILIGVGFLLILISFGSRPRRRGGPKKEEKKPTT